MSEKSLVQDIIDLREKVAEYERQYNEDTEDMARAIVLYETLKAENERLSMYEGMIEKLADENIRYRDALEFIADTSRFSLAIVQEHAREVLEGV